MSLDTTIAGVSSDSFWTLVQISEYFTNYKPDFSLWTAASESEKEVVARLAALDISSLNYPGRKYDQDQALAFPICSQDFGTWDTDPTTGEVSIPVNVGRAQAEAAYFRLERQSSAIADSVYREAESFKMGDISITKKSGGLASIIGGEAAKLLSQYIKSSTQFSAS